jgi:DNA ligase-1
MRRWSEVAERVAATTRTSEKTALLADYFASLDATELPIAAVFLTGRPFAEADQRAAGLGWSAIATTVTDLAGVPRAALGEAYDRSSDLGKAVEDVLTLAGHDPDPSVSPSLPEVAAAYAEIERASGPAAKSGILRALLARADPLTAKYIVKVLSGELRIGLREGLVDAAIAKGFARPLDAVKWAGMLTGDIGQLAALARDDRLAEASLSLFHPIKFMLASPAEDAAEIIKRLGVPVWVEDKYDGIRAQLHRIGGDVRLYSRDLHDISGQFPEIVDGARGLAWDGILDGEILAWRDGAVLPFIALQARLGRKSPSAAIRAEVPVIYVAFDVLGLGRGGHDGRLDVATGRLDGANDRVASGNGRADVANGRVADGNGTGHGHAIEPLLREPLEDRRRRLEALALPLAGDGGVFALSHLVSVTSEGALEDAFLGARERRNEGLMVKDPRSIYSPGRRGLGWLKMKKALATIDCVVVGVEVGHGKRHGVLSDYTFAVRDTDNDKLVTIGKAYSGLTDAEIATMTAWFEAHTIQRFGRYRQVEPTVVVEVAFDVIVRSKRHQSGYSLRFPRIANLRPDKPLDEIDTLETVRALFEGLQHGAEQLVTAGARK